LEISARGRPGKLLEPPRKTPSVQSELRNNGNPEFPDCRQPMSGTEHTYVR